MRCSWPHVADPGCVCLTLTAFYEHAQTPTVRSAVPGDRFFLLLRLSLPELPLPSHGFGAPEEHPRTGTCLFELASPVPRVPRPRSLAVRLTGSQAQGATAWRDEILLPGAQHEPKQTGMFPSQGGECGKSDLLHLPIGAASCIAPQCSFPATTKTNAEKGNAQAAGRLRHSPPPHPTPGGRLCALAAPVSISIYVAKSLVNTLLQHRAAAPFGLAPRPVLCGPWVRRFLVLPTTWARQQPVLSAPPPFHSHSSFPPHSRAPSHCTGDHTATLWVFPCI